MEIERPFRIKTELHKEAEKSRKTEPALPVHKELGRELQDLERRAVAFREQNMNPAHVEKMCQGFEKE